MYFHSLITEFLWSAKIQFRIEGSKIHPKAVFDVSRSSGEKIFLVRGAGGSRRKLWSRVKVYLRIWIWRLNIILALLIKAFGAVLFRKLYTVLMKKETTSQLLFQIVQNATWNSPEHPTDLTQKLATEITTLYSWYTVVRHYGVTIEGF